MLLSTSDLDLERWMAERKRKYSKSASKDVASAMRRRKKGTLRSGPGGKGGKVKSRKQAIAIGISEARAKGKKVPRKRGAKRSSSRSRSR
jgi:hypothetical protein